MADRYFVESPINAGPIVLGGAEAHHLSGVMRAKPGDEVTLFDGSGDEFTARVEQVGKREVRLAIVDRRSVDRELRRDVTLCTALPKGDRQRWLVEKAVELGVRRVVPLQAARSVAQPDAGACERLRRTVIEASKQCGRNRLMEVTDGCGLAAADRHLPAGTVKLFAHPGGSTSPSQLVASGQLAATTPLAFLIGPEGGWTDAEADAALAAGWETLDLGPRILRMETAATALAAWAASLE